MEEKNNNKEAQKTEDELWDEAFNNPDSAVFFENLESQIEDALATGDFIEGAFDEEE
jgi:hypothetical protein